MTDNVPKTIPDPLPRLAQSLDGLTVLVSSWTTDRDSDNEETRSEARRAALDALEVLEQLLLDSQRLRFRLVREMRRALADDDGPEPECTTGETDDPTVT